MFNKQNPSMAPYKVKQFSQFDNQTSRFPLLLLLRLLPDLPLVFFLMELVLDLDLGSGDL